MISNQRGRSPAGIGLRVLGGVAVAGVVTAAIVIGSSGSSGGTAVPTAEPATSSTLAAAALRGDQVAVKDAAGLQQALAQARPGMTITLADGVYSGKGVRDPSGAEPGRFVASAMGTAAAPIVLTGSRNAVLDGGGTGGGYAVHLNGARYWHLSGFTVRSAAKGIVLDHAQFNVLDHLHVTDIGAEGIHFRSFSSDNLLADSTVDHTGVKSPNYGEGVYLGSARSNWGSSTDGQPDRSDRNRILDNAIVDTAAENVDVKEGSSNGVVQGNRLGGSKIASKNSADSFIDVKGNGYLIAGNVGVTVPRPGSSECGDPTKKSGRNPFCDGMQVHVVLAGWGEHNTFEGNTLAVNAPGAGIWLQNTAVGLGNVVKCDNRVSGAAAGTVATDHYTPLPCTP